VTATGPTTPLERAPVAEAPLLSVNDLHVTFRGRSGQDSRNSVYAVRGVSFGLGRGDTVGLVGESGSGKSVTALSLVGLLPDTADVTARAITLADEPITGLSPKAMRALRGRRLAMVFQDPMTSLNPLMPIGRQVAEMLTTHERGLSRAERRQRVIDLLADVRIPEPDKRYKSFPHEFSGGMRQRVMIAMAMALRPEVLIADEPTTALDVTIQDQILRLMRRLQRESGTSILLITHDLGVVASLCSRVLVMYAGLILEEAPVDQLFARPLHPYTLGLLGSLPSARADTDEPLQSIPGQPPDMTNPPPGCPFVDRCQHARARCQTHRPPYYSVGAGHRSLCWLLDPAAPADGNPFAGVTATALAETAEKVSP
jgi:oligopeptide transport system ATP-binding protein